MVKRAASKLRGVRLHSTHWTPNETLAEAEAAVAASASRLSDDQVAIFLSLGGGWETWPVQNKADDADIGHGQNSRNPG